MMAVLSSFLSVRLALACAGRGLADAARWSRGWLLLTVVLHSVQAVLPALQVLLISVLLGRLADGAVGSGLAVPLVLLTVVVGAAFPLAQVAWQSSQRMGLRLMLRYQERLLEAVARATPRQLADGGFVRDVETAQLGISAPGLAAIPGQALQVITAVVTAVSLCATIATFNLVSGLLVGASLLPTVFAFTLIARVELAGMPRLAKASRRANHLTEQLLQQRTGTELAALQSGHKVATLAVSARARFVAVLEELTRFGTRMELACAAGTVLLLGGALTVMVFGSPNPAGAAASIAGIISGIHAIRSCGNAFGQLVTAAPKADLYRRVLTTLPPMPPADPVARVDHLAVTDLHHTYPGATEPALRGVSFEAGRGQMIALVGVNGAGKTTALNAALGIVDPDRGLVSLDGFDADTLADADRLARFGLLTQEFGRYELTVRETVLLGTPDVAVPDERVWRALERAHAADFVRALPGGLDCQLGQQWGGSGLSGGQWQRIALARIHLRDAPIWVLDEPTSAIDAEAERDIFAELRQVKDNHITIVVSHRAWTLRAMDHIHVFDQGRIVEHGTFAELLRENGRFATLFAEQTAPPRR